MAKFKRRPMKKKRSRKLFSKTAKRVHKKNRSVKPMRGGIRA